MENLLFISVVILMVGLLYKFYKQVLFGIISAVVLGLISYAITGIFSESVVIPIVSFMAFFGFIIGVKMANSID